MRLNFAPLVVFSTASTVRFMSANTPMPDRIVHSAAIMTTPAIPTETDSRNDSFMADHGSTRETLSLTRRGAAEASPAGVTPPPAVCSGLCESSARSAVLGWPAVLTGCLLRCRLDPAPTLRYPHPWPPRTRCPSRLGRRDRSPPPLRALHHPGHHRRAQPRYRGRRCVPPRRSSRPCLVWRTAQPWCSGRSDAPRRLVSGRYCPSPSQP